MQAGSAESRRARSRENRMAEESNTNSNTNQATTAPKTIRIKLVKSPICTPEKHRRVVRGLGLGKINSVVEKPDTPAIRGMVNKIPHLVAVID
jgi:large subunit ribosomal protein L30